jgi:hypothetical protein
LLIVEWLAASWDVASNTPEKWLVSHSIQNKGHKTFFTTIRTMITHLDKRGTDVASATTVDTPPWSDEKK